MLHSSAFESINLAATATELPVPESSDDGLDPNDFLSQNAASARPDPPTIGSELPTLENSTLSHGTPDTDLAGSLSLQLQASESMFGALRAARFPQRELPLEYLQTENDALTRAMRRTMKAHVLTLELGDDSTAVRAQIARTFDQLSENCLFLNEAYAKELASAELLLDDFEKWDKKRTKVLRRIQSIKSENNKYGSKLAALLSKRSDIDSEIHDLETRIQALKASRSAITLEIDETSSVLESKSAKYVNIFRELEKQGHAAISDYLVFNGVPEQNTRLLLRTEPVDAGFAYKPDKVEEPVHHSPLPQSPVPLKASQMGIQALELPEDHAVPQENDSPYALGYAKGTEQLAKMRNSIKVFVHSVLVPPPTAKRSPKVDDVLNTITEQIDLVPIVELLSYKVEALEDLMVKTSRMSASFHEDGSVWKDVCKYLDAQETSLYQLLLESHSSSAAIETLKASFDFLQHQLQVQREKLPSRGAGPTDFLSVVLYREVKTLAIALDKLTGKATYAALLELPDSSVMEQSSLLTGKVPNLSMRITAAGYQPPVVSTISTAKFNSTAETIKRNAYPASSKAVKKE